MENLFEIKYSRLRIVSGLVFLFEWAREFVFFVLFFLINNGRIYDSWMGKGK